MPKSIAELQKDLQSRDWKVRAQAADSLGNLGDKKATTILADTLNDQSRFVRMAAIRSLGRLGDPKAIPVLIASLSDPVFMIRQDAIWSLGEIGDSSAIAALQPFVGDQTAYAERALTVGKLAATAIARIQAKTEETKATSAAAESKVEAAGDTGTPAREGSTLTPEERKAKREAALARKRAAEGGEPTGAPAGAVNEASVAPSPAEPASAAAQSESGGEHTLTPEERKAKREAALARKRAQKNEGS